jgi:hypothetical protein
MLNESESPQGMIRHCQKECERFRAACHRRKFRLTPDRRLCRAKFRL